MRAMRKYLKETPRPTSRGCLQNQGHQVDDPRLPNDSEEGAITQASTRFSDGGDLTAPSFSTSAKAVDVPPNVVECLTYTAKEACAALGISNTSLWRWERRGLVKPMPGIRHKLYSRKALSRFVETATA